MNAVRNTVKSASLYLLIGLLIFLSWALLSAL